MIEIKYDGCVIDRFWIDSSRGYICPLVQCFNEDGSIDREGKSNRYFLHEKTGRRPAQAGFILRMPLRIHVPCGQDSARFDLVLRPKSGDVLPLVIPVQCFVVE